MRFVRVARHAGQAPAAAVVARSVRAAAASVAGSWGDTPWSNTGQDAGRPQRDEQAEHHADHDGTWTCRMTSRNDGRPRATL